MKALDQVVCLFDIKNQRKVFDFKVYVRGSIFSFKILSSLK